MGFLEECGHFTSIYEGWLHWLLVWKLFAWQPKDHPSASSPISPPHLLSYCWLLGSQAEETLPARKGLKCEECLQVPASACGGVCQGRWEHLGLKEKPPYPKPRAQSRSICPRWFTDQSKKNPNHPDCLRKQSREPHFKWDSLPEELPRSRSTGWSWVHPL